MFAMNRVIMTLCGILCYVYAAAAVSFMYDGKKMTTSPSCLYVNDKKKTAEADWRFSHVAEALRYAERNGVKDGVTYIYVEPSVYWMDNPDDPEVRRPKKGSVPYAMELELSNLCIIGLGESPEDVVFAVNRGQTQGADGNYTMFHIKGDNVSARNVTFGNYCNVDLVYKRDSSKNRPRRKQAIVQAQIGICEGDNYRFDNCRFISRLNLCPFVGVPHTDYENCYFECTDDALSGTGTYKKCRFTFFSSKPFYTTDKSIGARFIDCDIYTKTHGTQYLTKVSGPVTMERCRWTSDDPELRIEWDKRPDPRYLCMMTDCTLNGKPLMVPTPTEPLPLSLPPFYVRQTDVVPGQWTADCYKPKDTEEYPWTADNSKSAWGYAEGMDGAEGEWGLVQLQKGARLMYTPRESEVRTDQHCIVTLCPCKGAGQGFGSATGQYLDICIKFDTHTLTGYGIRFIRTPEYDHAVEVYLVEYNNGEIKRISEPERCDLFKSECGVELSAVGDILTVNIKHNAETQTLKAQMTRVLPFSGFHLQHTGSTGASATVIKSISLG